MAMLITLKDLKRKLDFTQMKNMDELDSLLKLTPIILTKLRQEDRKTTINEDHRQERNKIGKGKRVRTNSSINNITIKKTIGRDYFVGDPEQLESRATIPKAFRECIERELQGREIKLIIQKHLFRTDLERSEGRFSIPQNKMCKGVLTKEEEEWLATARGEKNEVLGMELKMVDPELEVRKMILKHWGMRKPNGRVSSMYLLAKYWNDVVKEHGFKEGEVVQLWGFRMGEELPGNLGLALVRLGMIETGASSGRGA